MVEVCAYAGLAYGLPVLIDCWNLCDRPIIFARSAAAAMVDLIVTCAMADGGCIWKACVVRVSGSARDYPTHTRLKDEPSTSERSYVNL